MACGSLRQEDSDSKPSIEVDSTACVAQKEDFERGRRPSLVLGEGREGGAHPVDHWLGRISVGGSDKDRTDGLQTRTIYETP